MWASTLLQQSRRTRCQLVSRFAVRSSGQSRGALWAIELKAVSAMLPYNQHLIRYRRVH
jgi:hypothetical protein